MALRRGGNAGRCRRTNAERRAPRQGYGRSGRAGGQGSAEQGSICEKFKRLGLLSSDRRQRLTYAMGRRGKRRTVSEGHSGNQDYSSSACGSSCSGARNSFSRSFDSNRRRKLYLSWIIRADRKSVV